jgi:pyruvate formate lyase activating enzyme
MLENAAKIASSGQTELSIRVPVVPGFNDTVAEITAIARFASELKTVHNLHLLPYHRLGEDKYAGLGREYLMKDVLPPSDELMQKLLVSANKASGNINCQIGG